MRQCRAARTKHRFWRISAAGIFFQGGATAVDTSTIIAALVHGLTGSAVAVGTAAAIGRFGWLFPQILVAYYAQRRTRRLPFYIAAPSGAWLVLPALPLCSGSAVATQVCRWPLHSSRYGPSMLS